MATRVPEGYEMYIAGCHTEQIVETRYIVHLRVSKVQDPDSATPNPVYDVVADAQSPELAQEYALRKAIEMLPVPYESGL